MIRIHKELIAESVVVLNDARDRSSTSLNRIHQNFWRIPTFTGAIRQLQIDPSNRPAYEVIEKWNTDVEQKTAERNYATGAGSFPLTHLKRRYETAHELRKQHEEANDPQKPGLATRFAEVRTETEEYCQENGYPKSRAWQHQDINQRPDWPALAEPSTSSSNSNSNSSSVPGSDVAGSNGGSVAGSGTEAGTSTGTDSNEEDTEMGNAMDKLTLAGEPVEAKRKVFKNFQFLVKEQSGLHVWKSAEVHPNLNLDTIPIVEKPTKDFTAQHKRRYKSMRWIAMSVDDAITIGAGRYPPIYAMVEWLGDLEDTLMTRSELIKLAGPRVDQDLPSHLPYRKMIEFEGRQVFVMSD